MRDEATTFEELGAWIGAVVSKGAHRLELRHTSSGGRVREWRVESTSDASSLALEVQASVDSDGRFSARSRGIYVVLAYRATGGAYFERLYLVANEGLDDDEERGTPEAIIVQHMRHTEASARLALGHTNEVVRHYQRLLDAAHERIRELESRHNEVMQLYETLTLAQHERELATMKVKSEESRREYFKEKLDLLVPVAMNRLLGQGKGAPVLGDEMIRQLLKSLRPEQMQHIASLLEPQQMTLLAELYAGYGERELAREKAKTGEPPNDATKAA